jgi:hypothetical protein
LAVIAISKSKDQKPALSRVTELLYGESIVMMHAVSPTRCVEV